MTFKELKELLSASAKNERDKKLATEKKGVTQAELQVRVRGAEHRGGGLGIRVGRGLRIRIGASAEDQDWGER
eukprot:4193159-Prymnesium_polylepis.1